MSIGQIAWNWLGDALDRPVNLVYTEAMEKI